jgi:hypothetical protein
VIFPRLTELLMRLLKYPRQIDLSHHASYIQVAVSVICAGILSHGLPGAKFFRIYRDEKLQKETQKFDEFVNMQKSQRIQEEEKFMRTRVREILEEESAAWKKKYEDLASRVRRDRDSKQEGVDEKTKTLENKYLQKIEELEKQRILDHRKITTLGNVNVVKLL